MRSLSIYAGMIALLFLNACTKENTIAPDPTTGLTMVGSGNVAGAATRATLYSDMKQVETGFTHFFILLQDSATGKYIDEAHVHLNPIMNMGTMSHAAPFEEPTSENAVNHLFPCNVTFLMPSSAGRWTLDILVHNHATGKSGVLTLPITVSEPIKPRLLSFTDPTDGSTYFAALVQPSAPRIGMNDMELAMYKRTGMMSFPADSSLRISINPEMPGMGHGSPNNVDPAHIGGGHYKGKVNFTMSGLWRIHLGINQGETSLDATKYFDIEF